MNLQVSDDHIEGGPEPARVDYGRRIAGALRSLFDPVDGATAALFRILFGALMAGESFYRIFPQIGEVYAPGRFHFTYPYLEWVKPWPGVGMHLQVIVMGFAALGVMAGFRTRLSAFVFLIAYTHLWLLDASTFNNHFYLISLLAAFFTIAGANACWSLDNLRVPPRGEGWVPRWNVWLLRFQFVVVYFYGGVAKINGDWLRGEPLRNWLERRAEGTLMESMLVTEGAVDFFAYGGLLFDLSIGFLLLFRRTRLPAVAMLVFFHCTNSWLFKIDVFPWLALASTVMFFDPETPRRWMQNLDIHVPPPPPRPLWQTGVWARAAILMGLLLFCAIQLAVPLRHLLYKGNVNWTDEGHTFSWHMKMSHRVASTVFEVRDPDTGQNWTIGTREQLEDLAPRQRLEMIARPHLILQYAHYLADKFRGQGVKRPEVRVRSIVSLNGRPLQPLIDPAVNLAAESDSPWKTPAWILPLPENLPIGDYPARTEEPRPSPQ
ncbi:MAG: HTTM domain-containing protein [Candidatus Hydrogenedentes bacterium]|nr:HTTM domain-containing protein [Candidatus Hydrogenedentota bacterium]